MKKLLLLFCCLSLFSCSTPEGCLKEVQRNYPEAEIVSVSSYSFMIKHSPYAIRYVYCGSAFSDNITTNSVAIFSNKKEK